VFYFAYASNLSKQQMQIRCPDSKPKFVAILSNYKLVFTGWSRSWKGAVATIKPFRGETVHGAIYEVTEACLRQLDKYEAGYTRLNVTVFDEDNAPQQGVAYIKSGQLEESLPSKEYAAVIRQGYRDWGIA
jgi:gamma-glutamylcyclotransferase (GGCT)/AIG2-like uncharacterized protein YtfP